jgi:hypothetical protein
LSDPWCLLLLQVVCGSESLLVLTSDRPLQHAGNTSTNSSNTHAGPNVKKQQHQQQQSLFSLVDQAASLTDASPTAAAAGGDMSMDGVEWVDVEGQGPFFCPAPRAGSGCRVSVTTSNTVSAAAAEAAAAPKLQLISAEWSPAWLLCLHPDVAEWCA